MAQLPLTNPALAAPTASSATNIISSVTNLFRSYGPSVFNGVIVVSTIGGQSLISKLTFTCPCSYPINVYHSAAFLIGPCLALFLFGVLFNSNTWIMVHGCCYRASSAYHPLSTAILYWLEILSQASIAPVAWLFVACLDGSYYTCLRAAIYCPIATASQCSNYSLTPTNNAQTFADITAGDVCGACVCSLDKVTADLLASQSQVIAWLLISSVGAIAFIVICLVRVCDRYTLTQANYVDMAREVEKGVFEEVAREHAAEMARQNARAFFAEKQLLKADWDLLSTLPSLESPFVLPNKRIVNIHNSPSYNFTKLESWNRNHAGLRRSPAPPNENGSASTNTVAPASMPHGNIKFE